MTTATQTPTGTATEVVANRGRSRLGSVQLHFRLSPPLDGHTDVAVTHGDRDVYVFAAADVGGLSDAALLRRIPGADTAEALESLGYTLS